MSTLSMKQKAVIGLSALVIASVPATALAWHPKGTIKKEVMNVTQGIAYSDANTTATAVKAKPGDTLKYRITVSNVAEPASREWNDLHYVVMTDKFPAGVTAAKTDIRESIGLILPKKSVVREYEVKVGSSANGSIKNTACFSGDSKVHDNPQSGCDVAYIDVTKPAATPSPSPTPSPSTTPVPTQTPVPTTTPEVDGKGEVLPATLPETGAEMALGSLAGIGGMAYATRSYLRSRNSLKQAMKNKR
jgi:uncharacterized repeat protein (TIGR01451 family)